MPTDRRRSQRRLLVFPLRLRLGNGLFPGHARDLSVDGIGLWFIPQTTTISALREALTGHQRGAIEVPFPHRSFVARVCIVHTEPRHGSVRVGLAFNTPGEATRLLQWLEDYGAPMSSAS